MAQLEVADVFRQFGPSYLEAFGEGMLPSHRRAIEDIVACRTEAMGGHVFQCGGCGKTFYACHGCRNRSCPACHTAQTRRWLETRSDEILPCTYYHLCITLPSELRAAFRSNQRDCYSLFMKASSQAVLELCADKRHMGAVPALMSVLHTWSAPMNYHPHVHLLVSGGGIGLDNTSWRESKAGFLIPLRALSRLVCGKFMAMLKKARPDLEAQIAAKAWKRAWYTWGRAWGKGETAVLEYLARYVHRIAITNGRILAMDGETVSFRYKDRKANKMRLCKVSGHEFMRRYLQHMLPKGFHKVRYCGLWHSSRRAQRQDLRHTMLLEQAQQAPPQLLVPAALTHAPGQDTAGDTPNPPCPHCGSRDTTCVATLRKAHNAKRTRASP
jgi:Putative transposase/Transposase zinc-binding domain